MSELMALARMFKVQVRNAGAREDLDRFFTKEIFPELCHLHISGNLPNLAKDPLWMAIEAEWDKASAHSPLACNEHRVKGLMQEFLESIKKREEYDERQTG